jgi:hypothetical protein
LCNTFVIARLLLPKRRKSTANIRTHKRKYLNAQKILAQDFKRNILAELRNTCRRLKVEISQITARFPASNLGVSAWQTSLLVIHLNQMAKKPAVCSNGSTSNGVSLVLILIPQL